MITLSTAEAALAELKRLNKVVLYQKTGEVIFALQHEVDAEKLLGTLPHAPRREAEEAATVRSEPECPFCRGQSESVRSRCTHHVRDFLAPAADGATAEPKEVDYAEDARIKGEYILKLGALLGCADGDETPEQRITSLREAHGGAIIAQKKAVERAEIADQELATQRAQAGADATERDALRAKLEESRLDLERLGLAVLFGDSSDAHMIADGLAKRPAAHEEPK